MRQLQARSRKGLMLPRRGEDGFTIVEVMVAIMILGIALAALAQLAGGEMVASLRTRIRQVAISYVNQELETLRSTAYTSIAMDPNDNPPSSPPSGMTTGGKTYAAVLGTAGCDTSASAGCLKYSQTVNLTNNQTTGNTFNFTETRWVGQVSGSTYKTVYITLTATSGSTFSYSAQTDVSGATTNNPSAVNGLEIDLEQVDSTGTVVTDPTTGNAEVPPDGFTVAVMQGSTTLVSGSTADGSWATTSSALTPGTAYTCTVSNPGTSGSYGTWVAYSAGDSSFACYDGSGVIQSYTSRWKQAGCTYDSSAADGTLQVTVLDTDGSAAPANVKVTLAAQSNPKQSKVPPAQTTTATNNVLSFDAQTGLWKATTSGGGVNPANDTACVFSGETTDMLIIVVSPPPKGQANANLTIPVENTYPGGTATMAVTAVDSTGTLTYGQQQDLDGCGSTCTSTNFVVPVYTNTTYTVYIDCVGVGGITTNPPYGSPQTSFTTATVTGNTSYNTPVQAYKCPTS